MEWNYKKLSELAEVSSGGTPKKSNKDFWSGDIPWYSSGELNDFYTIAPKAYITESGLLGSNAKLFPKGSLLIGMYDTAALKMSILDRKGTFNQAIAGVKPNKDVSLSFILYAINSMKPELLKLRRGVRQKNLNQGMIKDILIPDIPLPEQKRIVALLDNVFADSEQTRAKTEQNLKNACELFDSSLQQVFSQKGEGWVEEKLQSVCRLINGRAYKKPEMLSEGKYPLLRVGNFFTNRSWYYSDLELHEDKYCNNGDLLYAWSASFGPRIWKGDKTIYHYHIWKTDINSELMLKNFLFYWFYWDATNVKKEHGAGSTMIHVSMTSMNARNISYPSINEQKMIVDKLQSLDSKCKELEVIYNNKLNLIDELKKSILQKAFNGELSTVMK